MPNHTFQHRPPNERPSRPLSRPFLLLLVAALVAPAAIPAGQADLHPDCPDEIHTGDTSAPYPLIVSGSNLWVDAGGYMACVFHGTVTIEIALDWLGGDVDASPACFGDVRFIMEGQGIPFPGATLPDEIVYNGEPWWDGAANCEEWSHPMVWSVYACNNEVYEITFDHHFKWVDTASWLQTGMSPTSKCSQIYSSWDPVYSEIRTAGPMLNETVSPVVESLCPYCITSGIPETPIGSPFTPVRTVWSVLGPIIHNVIGPDPVDNALYRLGELWPAFTPQPPRPTSPDWSDVKCTKVVATCGYPETMTSIPGGPGQFCSAGNRGLMAPSHFTIDNMPSQAGNTVKATWRITESTSGASQVAQGTVTLYRTTDPGVYQTKVAFPPLNMFSGGLPPTPGSGGDPDCRWVWVELPTSLTLSNYPDVGRWRMYGP